jgi:hypothetical protein
MADTKRQAEPSADAQLPPCGDSVVEEDLFRDRVKWTIVIGAFFVVASVGSYCYLEAQPGHWLPGTIYLPALFGLAAILFLIAGIGLLKRKAWARMYGVGLWERARSSWQCSDCSA